MSGYVTRTEDGLLAQCGLRAFDDRNVRILKHDGKYTVQFDREIAPDENISLERERSIIEKDGRHIVMFGLSVDAIQAITFLYYQIEKFEQEESK